MQAKPTGIKFTAESARTALEGMGGSILFEKVLTSSDANGTGRLVIPKSQAEAHFPYLETQQGMSLHLTDTDGKKHTFRFRFWINNQSRMYLLENTAEVQAKYRMQAGDVLVFAKLLDGNYIICGRKGTKDDVSRKPAVRRQQPAASGGGGDGDGAGEGGSPGTAAAGEGGKGAKRVRVRAGVETSKSKRMKLKREEQAVQSLFTYWSGYSLPMKRDGVFRAVPNSATQEGGKVVAQFGAWSAIVYMGGELFQAFFDTLEAANAAFDAAMQSNGREPAPAAAEDEATPPAAAAGAAGAAAGARGPAAAPVAGMRRLSCVVGASEAAAGAAGAAGGAATLSQDVSPGGTPPADAAAAAAMAGAAELTALKQELQQQDQVVLPLVA